MSLNFEKFHEILNQANSDNNNNLVVRNTFAITLRAIVLIAGWRATIKAVKAALLMVNVILTKTVTKK